MIQSSKRKTLQNATTRHTEFYFMHATDRLVQNTQLCSLYSLYIDYWNTASIVYTSFEPTRFVTLL
jgi:hypothetical protein